MADDHDRRPCNSMRIPCALPWWVGFALACASHVCLRYVARGLATPDATVPEGDAPTLLLRVCLCLLVDVCQCLLPAVLAACSAAGWSHHAGEPPGSTSALRSASASVLRWLDGMPLSQGALLALASWFGLRLAHRQVLGMIDAQPGSAIVLRQVAWLYATYLGQYLLPIAFVICSLRAAGERARREVQAARTGPSPAPTAAQEVAWQQYVRLVSNAFERRGFVASRALGAGMPMGIDLVLSDGSRTYLVRLRDWRARTVGVETVRGVHATMVGCAAHGAFVVAGGYFTGVAHAFAIGRNVGLIDRPMLHEMLLTSSAVLHAWPWVTSSARMAATSQPVLVQLQPTCPSCGAEMVLRLARRGHRAGEDFWGCRRFPACSGSRRVHSTSAIAALPPATAGRRR